MNTSNNQMESESSQNEESNTSIPNSPNYYVQKRESLSPKKKPKQQQQQKNNEDDDDDDDDEIMEEEDECESPAKFFPSSSNQNSQQNLHNIETNESLRNDSSMNNIESRVSSTPEQKKNKGYDKIYQRSCDQIDEYEGNQKRKQFELTLNVNRSSQDRDSSSSSNPTPSRYIQKRVSMLPMINAQQQKLEQENILTPSRRKSLPEFSLGDCKEPDYNDDNYDTLYKIYAGDAIDENNKMNDSDPYKMMEEDGFVDDCGIEEEESNAGQRRASKMPKKKKTVFMDGNNEEEDAAQTPIIKGSKFDEDRYIIQKDKIENGGITPQKYLPQEQQQQQYSVSNFKFY